MKNFLISLLTICLSCFATLYFLNNRYNKVSLAKTKNKVIPKKTITKADTEIKVDKPSIPLKEDISNNDVTNFDTNNINFSEILASYNSWRKYHKEYIDLSTDFIAVNSNGNEISKKEFLNELKTGNFIPKKLFDDEYMYQLHDSEDNADKKISKSIKSSSNTLYKYLLKEGKAFPDFDFKDLNGNTFSKNELLGKIVVIKCWFIQCKVCVEEFPKINELYDRYESHENVVFLSLAFDKPEKLKKFLTRKEFRYPVIAEQKKFMKKEMGVIQYPTHIILDEYGDIKKMVNNIDSLILSLDTMVNGNILPEDIM